MTRDEIVTALRERAERSVGNEWGSSIFGLYDNLSAAADLIENQQRHIEAQAKEIDALRNELCLKCGNYTLAHEGACNGCRWRR